MTTTALLKADRVALAATNAAFTEFCGNRMLSLCERWQELFIEQEIFNVALRAIERVPHLYTDTEKRMFTERARQIDCEMFKIAYECGVLIFDCFEPMRVRRFRDTIRQNNSERC